MKKTNIFKILMTLILAFAINGAFAQFVADTTAGSSELIDTVTVDKSVPYYVEPDSYFSPTFTAPSTNVNTTFAWDFTNFGTAPTAANYSASNNYVELTFNATNATPEYLYVSESSPTSCSGDRVRLAVRVIDSTTVDFNTTANSTYFGADTTFCDGNAREDAKVAVDFVTQVSDNYSIQLAYTLEIMTYVDNVTTTAENWWDAAKTTSSGTQSFAVDKSEGSQVTGITTLTQDLDKSTDLKFNCVNDGGTVKKTVYKYTILGVNDRISRKSDYLTNNNPASLSPWTWYDFSTTAAPKTFSITVLPAPVTGPIYHISNMWAN